MRALSCLISLLCVLYLPACLAAASAAPSLNPLAINVLAHSFLTPAAQRIALVQIADLVRKLAAKKENRISSCPICLNDFNDPDEFPDKRTKIITLPCGHIFCETCSEKTSTCALCRGRKITRSFTTIGAFQELACGEEPDRDETRERKAIEAQQLLEFEILYPFAEPKQFTPLINLAKLLRDFDELSREDFFRIIDQKEEIFSAILVAINCNRFDNFRKTQPTISLPFANIVPLLAWFEIDLLANDEIRWSTKLLNESGPHPWAISKARAEFIMRQTLLATLEEQQPEIISTLLSSDFESSLRAARAESRRRTINLLNLYAKELTATEQNKLSYTLFKIFMALWTLERGDCYQQNITELISRHLNALNRLENFPAAFIALLNQEPLLDSPYVKALRRFQGGIEFITSLEPPPQRIGDLPQQPAEPEISQVKPLAPRPITVPVPARTATQEGCCSMM